MHFLKASQFGLVSMNLKKRNRHCEYLPVASIGGRSLEPTAMMLKKAQEKDKIGSKPDKNGKRAARRWFEKEPPRSITTWDDLVSKFINEFFSPSRTTNLRNEISNFQQKFDESFHEAWERYKDLLRACPHHGFTELHQLDTFHNALNPADQDSLNAAAGGNLLEKSPQDALTIIENKSKVRNSRSKLIASIVNACDNHSSSELAKLAHAVNHQTSAVTTAMTAMLKQFQSNLPPAQVKAVEEICVTCGGAHPYYQCLAIGDNTFPEYRDNIQGYVSAATGNFNQGNPGYHPQGVANQMRSPGFTQPNLQNNQNRFGQPQGFNLSPNFNQEQPYQATQSNQNFHLNKLEKIKRMNDVSLKAMQNQIDMMKNKLRNEMKTSIQTSLSNQTNEIKNMMASLLHMNTASTSGSGTLPGNTIANPKGKLKAITTRSGLVTEGPIVPNPPKLVNPEEDERVEEMYTDPDHAKYNIKVPPPPPELANTPFNENCSAVILKKLPEKLGDPGKFLIPCGFSELKCKALADLGASINLMPLSVWKQLGLPDLIPTQMTLELANRTICTPDRITRDVFVPVGKFTFLADFVVVDYESDPRVPLILGRPFLRTARALIDVHGEEMILCDGDKRLTLNMKHNTASYSNHPYRDSVNLVNIFNLSKLANRAIYTPDGITRDVFVPVGKFTFPADFVVVDYESDPRVPLILGSPFLRTARTLIDVHSEEMILRDGDERLTLNMKHDTASYSNHPYRESVNLINIFNLSSEDCLKDLVSHKQSGNPTFSLHKEIASLEVIPEDVHGEEMILRDGDERLTLNMKHDTASYSNHPYRESVNLINIFNLSKIASLEVIPEFYDSKGCTFLSEELPDIDSLNDIHPHFDDDPLSGSTTYSANLLFEEFADLSEELPDIDSLNDIHPHFDDDPLSGSTTYSANLLLEEFADELALISYCNAPLHKEDRYVIIMAFHQSIVKKA
nr:hypothetical protein [Tanacetum cinerariifolium]